MVLSVIKWTMFQFLENLNLEGHLNRFIGSNVTAILVNGGILPIGGVASGGVCVCSLRSRLVCWRVWYQRGLCRLFLSYRKHGEHQPQRKFHRFANPNLTSLTSCLNSTSKSQKQYIGWGKHRFFSKIL